MLVSLTEIAILVAAFIIGLIVMAVAWHKGRKDMAWSFFYGLAWGIVALFYYIVSPKIEEKKVDEATN